MEFLCNSYLLNEHKDKPINIYNYGTGNKTKLNRLV